MSHKLDLFEIDRFLAIHAIESRNCESWTCPTEVLDLADAIEEAVEEYHFSGGIVEGCYKPTVRRLTTTTGEPPKDWFQMRISLVCVKDIELDLRESFGDAANRLRDMAAQLEEVAGVLARFDPAKKESEVPA